MGKPKTQTPQEMKTQAMQTPVSRVQATESRVQPFQKQSMASPGGVGGDIMGGASSGASAKYDPRLIQEMLKRGYA